MTALTGALRVEGRILSASREDRTLEGLLLPYGEEGRTNLGRLTASAGAVTLPADPGSVILNIEHEGRAPIGKAVELTDTPEGIRARFAVAATRAGDDALEEAASGLRSGLSVEIPDPVIRAGQLLAGTLAGAGLVARGAFPSARLVAADAGELPEDEASTAEADEVVTIDGVQYRRVTKTLTETHTEPVENTEPTDNPEAPEPITQEDNKPMTASARAVARTGAAPTNGPLSSVASFTAALAASLTAGTNYGPQGLAAALQDVVPTSTPGIDVPQFVAELWSGKAYERRFIPLFNHADLTSWKVAGWRWKVRPTVDKYAGNKTAIPSNKPTTEPVSVEAQRFAGGHDIDRKFTDFGDEAFLASYLRAMTESYAKVSDLYALAEVLAVAGTMDVGTVPADVAPGLVSIVDGALSILSDVDALPHFAVVSPDLWRGIILTKRDDTLAYLDAAMGLDEGTLSANRFRLIPSGQLSTGQTLVGVRDAVTVHELGGGAPIRVSADNVAQGGIDEALFGYAAVNVHDKRGLRLVDADPATPPKG